VTDTGKATIETLQRLVVAFNAHDLDAVMSLFVDDPVLELPRGPNPWGQRFQGREEVRSGWPAASPASPMSTTARTVTGSPATGAARSGS
jgi:ketosteroid isomerase-like protein